MVLQVTKYIDICFQFAMPVFISSKINCLINSLIRQNNLQACSRPFVLISITLVEPMDMKWLNYLNSPSDIMMNRFLIFISILSQVLENHHVSTMYKIMIKEKYNILKNASLEQYRTIRKYAIPNILATDMKRHFEILK